jgi:hypothetical protein
MKMAKANEADLDAAMTLCSALESLSGWGPCVPAAVEKVSGPNGGEPFDRDDREQCVRVLGHLLDVADKGSIGRVVWGCSVMLDPRNKCVDPDSDVIEHHPQAKAGMQAHRARPIDEWHEDEGTVLWWTFPVEEPPYCGTPLCDNWDLRYTHWTPFIVPEQPALPATPPSND